MFDKEESVRNEKNKFTEELCFVKNELIRLRSREQFLNKKIKELNEFLYGSLGKGFLEIDTTVDKSYIQFGVKK